LAAADLLDVVQLDPRIANLVHYFYQHPFTELASDFDQISPESLSAFYEISFSSANLQRLTLEGRMDDIRNGSTGFSSNVQPNGASDPKMVANAKTTKNPVEPVLQPVPENRWGIWLNGFGDFVSVDSDFNARGYRFSTGGLDLGVDYRIFDNFVLGVMGDYAHSWTDLRPGTIAVNSGRGGLYATYFRSNAGSGTFYLNGGVYGGYNTYDSNRRVLGDTATGSTSGEEWSAFVSGGYDFHFGRLIAGPVASFQYTDVYVSGFSETGSLAPLQIHSNSEESLRSDLGFRASYHWQAGKIVITPYVTAAWEHEFKYSALPVTAGLAAVPGPDVTFTGPVEGQDSAVISAGFSIGWTSALSTYVGYDGQLGRNRYDANGVSGGIRFSF
jgi:outer membrane autotransporter protein